jgi:hypothetical protein
LIAKNDFSSFQTGDLPMTVITANAALEAILGPIKGEVEIRTSDGDLLGYFRASDFAKEEMDQNVKD